jgi:hypothetical protein
MGIHSMPEFLTESNWRQDFKATEQWVVGWNGALETTTSLKPILTELLGNAREAGNIESSEVDWISTTEAETVQYLRNAFLATKISFFNEMEEFCQAKQIDFETVRRVGVRDQRVGGSHSKVPGPDGLRGFGGSCLTKDLSALCTTIESAGMVPTLLRTVLNRNIHRDRKGALVGQKPEAEIRAELEAMSLRELRMMAQQRGVEIDGAMERGELEDRVVEAEGRPQARQSRAVATGGPSMFNITPQQERELQAQHQRRREQRAAQIKAVKNQNEALADASGRGRPRARNAPQQPPPGMTPQQFQMVQQEQRGRVQQQQQMQSVHAMGGPAGRNVPGQYPRQTSTAHNQYNRRIPPQQPRRTGGPVMMNVPTQHNNTFNANRR